MLALGVGACGPAATAVARTITLGEALNQATQVNPYIASRQAYANIATASIEVAKSYVLPQAEVQAVDSTGYPGSTSYLGLGGIVGSPYRSGLGVGVTVQQMVYDFGRTDAAVNVAKKTVAYSKEDVRVAAQSVKLTALRAYVACARLQTSVSFLNELLHDTQVIAKEVRNFVHTGQRSIVERYLSDAQVQQAQTSLATVEAEIAAANKALSVAVGDASSSTTCGILETIPTWVTPENAANTAPTVAAAQARVDAAVAERETISAAYKPHIDALASLGWAQDTRLVHSSPYAVGIGISVPVFSGFRETYQLDENAALTSARRYEVETRQLELAEDNSRIDVQIAAATTRYEHLQAEVALAKKAFGIARSRYLEAEGGLTDLRESIRNMARAEIEANDALANSVEAIGTKALVNDGHLR